MATPRKYKVCVSFFPYGGNGAAPSEHPAIRNWWGKTTKMLDKHPLVESYASADFADTPITMTRNRAVRQAIRQGFDVLVMVDSDMVPDMYLDHVYGRTAAHAVDAKPFMEVALDVIDQHYERGPIIIGAPYCGPPPDESPYIFTWEIFGDGANDNLRIRMLSRQEAATAVGVAECAALPTGLIAYDLRAFQYSEPKPGDQNSWFYYTYTDQYQIEKTGTEDVMNTRDLSLAIQHHLGYNPLRVAWDCWAGHVKPWVVGKPFPTTVSQIEERFRRAVLGGVDLNNKTLDLGVDQPRGELGPKI